MVKVEGGLNISASIGIGPRTADPLPRSEVMRIIRDAEIANQEARRKLGLDSTAARLPNYLEMGVPMKI